jgi:hypothetical protein
VDWCILLILMELLDLFSVNIRTVTLTRLILEVLSENIWMMLWKKYLATIMIPRIPPYGRGCCRSTWPF